MPICERAYLSSNCVSVFLSVCLSTVHPSTHAYLLNGRAYSTAVCSVIEGAGLLSLRRRMLRARRSCTDPLPGDGGARQGGSEQTKIANWTYEAVPFADREGAGGGGGGLECDQKGGAHGACEGIARSGLRKQDNEEVPKEALAGPGVVESVFAKTRAAEGGEKDTARKSGGRVEAGWGSLCRQSRETYDGDLVGLVVDLFARSGDFRVVTSMMAATVLLELLYPG